MYILIIILPLLGSLSAGLLGRKIGIKGSQFITISNLVISSLFMSIAFYEVCICGSPVYINLGSWIDSEFLTISWEFLFDQLTVSLGLAVLYCSTLIHIYSIDYLSSDPVTRFGKTVLRDKLSNSGDTLKLLVPSYCWKTISGWNNYSCEVISQKINVSEMGYRGSKSDFRVQQPYRGHPLSRGIIQTKKSVKEQRVNGSWCSKKFKIKHLRCTLMGFERNYPINNPSNQLKVKNYSTLKQSFPVNAWFWTGLIDAEGSFGVVVDKNNKRTLGWRVQSKFQIDLHKRDLDLLLQLQDFWGGIGSIHKDSFYNRVIYSVDSIKDMITIIDHFKKYPLLTQKAADYILFKEVVILQINKCHLNIKGLNQIINIKASINKGLSEALISEFKEIYPVKKPVINTEKIPDPQWISGFVSGEGNFDVRIPKATNKIGYRVQLRFRITQHYRDIRLMKTIIKYLDSGNIYEYPNQNAVSIVIVNFSDIINKIIPFFEKNPLLGIKTYDYLDWCQIALLMKDSSHLTIEGLNKIRTIKSGMNKSRDISDI